MNKIRIKKKTIYYRWESILRQVYIYRNGKLLYYRHFGKALKKSAFESLVKDYYYSSDGDYAWKKDRLDRWILNVKSFLPVREEKILPA